MEVRPREKDITIYQKSYVAKILQQCNMVFCNHTDTPMEQRVKLNVAKKGTEYDVARYKSIIGSLRYLVNTRPDISFAVGLVSIFMEAPSKEHWSAVKRMLRYVAGTLDLGVNFKKGAVADCSLLGYTDSGCSGDLVHRKSTSGILFFLGDNLVPCSSQKKGL